MKGLVLFSHHRRPSGVLPAGQRLMDLTENTAARAAAHEREERQRKNLRIHAVEPERKEWEPVKPAVPEPAQLPMPKRGLNWREKRLERLYQAAAERNAQEMTVINGRSQSGKNSWAERRPDAR